MIRRAVRAAQNKKDEGVTAVEFSLVLPVIVLTVFFALYGAMYFYYGAVADHVARSVARQVSIPVGQTGSGYPDQATNGGQATVNKDAKSSVGTLLPDPTCAVSTWNNSTEPTNLPQTCPTSTPSGAPQQGDLVTVWVSYKLPVLDMFGWSGLDTITRSASERRQ